MLENFNNEIIYLLWQPDDGPEHGPKHVAVSNETNAND
jgi:hypothetical protein